MVLEKILEALLDKQLHYSSITNRLQSSPLQTVQLKLDMLFSFAVQAMTKGNYKEALMKCVLHFFVG